MEFQKFIPWVIVAPFGSPVVPDVYMIVITSSWVTSACPPSWPSNRVSACSYGLSDVPAVDRQQLADGAASL